jgi:hypothetical protein
MTQIQYVLNVSLQKLQYFAAWTVNHQDAVTGVAVAAFVLLHGVLILWLLRRVGRLVNEADRVRNLADGMALLTDTTEAGLTALIREVERLGARPMPAPARISRKNVARRVLEAAQDGNDLAEIAGQEAMSESEVRLHLMLANVQNRKTTAAKVSA